MIVDNEETTWPAVERAYDFVIPSYQMLIGRFEAADTRLSALATLIAVFTSGAPVFAKAVRQDIVFTAPMFFVVMMFAIAAAGLSITGRIRGHITLPNPQVLYQTALHETAWAFRKNSIYFAGQHFTANVAAIEAKSQFAICATVAFFLEIMSFVAWVAW